MPAFLTSLTHKGIVSQIVCFMEKIKTTKPLAFYAVQNTGEILAKKFGSE